MRQRGGGGAEAQAAILEALGALGDEAALARVHSSFRERDARVAQAAIEATGVLRSAGSIEPLLALLRDLEKWMER